MTQISKHIHAKSLAIAILVGASAAAFAGGRPEAMEEGHGRVEQPEKLAGGDHVTS